MPDPKPAAQAALFALILLHAVMLLSLFAGVAPHPPAQVAPFGMAPFIAAVLSAAAAAMIHGPLTRGSGRMLSATAAILSLVSFGPHKILDPALPLIWPAVAAAWVAIATLAITMLRSRKVDRHA